MRKKEENLNTASGLRIAMILLGIAVTPVLLSSSSLGNQLSSGSLISVVLLGGVILTLLSAITISVGEKARLPTYGIVKYSFGEKGAIAINILPLPPICLVIRYMTYWLNMDWKFHWHC